MASRFVWLLKTNAVIENERVFSMFLDPFLDISDFPLK